MLFKLFRISDSLELFQSLQEANQHHAQFWQNYAKVLEFNSNYQEAYHAYKNVLAWILMQPINLIWLIF